MATAPLRPTAGVESITDPMVYHDHDGSAELFDDALRTLKRMYQTKNDVITLWGG